jgi:hypothetical protein
LVVRWTGCVGRAKNILLTSMQRRLLLDPVDAQPLIKALSGRWHYSEDRLGNLIKDIPKKSHAWSDLGDSFCYLLSGLMPEMAEQLRPAKKVTVVAAYNPFR